MNIEKSIRSIIINTNFAKMLRVDCIMWVVYLLRQFNSGNSTLIVPSVPTSFLGVASENSWYLGNNKNAITLIPSQ
jgi:hypothetical protein